MLLRGDHYLSWSVLAGFEIQLTPKSCALKTEPSLHSLVPLVISNGRSLFSALLSEMATAKRERTRNSDANKLWSGNNVTVLHQYDCCCMFYYRKKVKERGQQSILACRIWLFVTSVAHTFAGDEVRTELMFSVIRRHFIDYNN